ncbi:MAG TPA: bifunctional serine/threonine-protein kinase/formylglycine-generating enzyme family protein [Planctomycetota bacterium]|nr:bifunctional serine/threonine-protein kinase/formylglycine-generating enzyme family protein [Planctomycetota bacterium]
MSSDSEKTQAPKTPPGSSPASEKTLIESPNTLQATRVVSNILFPGQSLPVQELTTDKMILAAPRKEFSGRTLPTLGGIPLMAKLGQGGMGAVYYGMHTRLNKEVAVKVLPFHLAEQQPDMVKRFFREAQIAAMVQSPHLVTVTDVNEEHGLVYLVMEFVSGESAGVYLRKVKQSGRPGLDEAEALDIVTAATIGLKAAHDGGIIHRDVKPDNILIPKSRTGDDRMFTLAKLADLGLARGEDLGQSLTMAQACMGTPGFMSPEQAMDAKAVGKQADVFSMGATLYALLAGAAPFTGTSPTKVVIDTAQTPHAPIHKTRPDVSDAVAAIIDKCLQKAPEKRYADAGALLDALKRVRANAHTSIQRGISKEEIEKAAKERAQRKAEAEALLAEAKRLTHTDPDAAMQKLIEAERKMQSDEEAVLTVLDGISAELAAHRKQLTEAAPKKKKAHESGIWQALSNAIPVALESKKNNDWDMVIAALEGPLKSLGDGDHPNRDLAEKLLKQAKDASARGDSAAALNGPTVTLDLGNGVTMELVRCPAGTFQMGSPPTEKGRAGNEVQHAVTISKPYFIGKYPVTQAQYEALVGSNPSEFKDPNKPVEMVNWDETQEYCKKLALKTGKLLRLPTEAEWEYACRAGTTTPFHFGENITPDQVNYDGNFPYGDGKKGLYRQQTTPVNAFPGNAWGIHDMHGNVWEWCSDWYGPYPPGAATDPKGPDTGKQRVMRGGSWNYRAALCRSATRYWDAPGERSSRRGFRLVLPT